MRIVLYMLCAVAMTAPAQLLAQKQTQAQTETRDWYSAGHGDVDTRAFIVEVATEQVQALLPAPLALNADFQGKHAGTHPVIFLFSNVMPRKAHLMPIYIDMPYREFSVFIPEVTHPDLQDTFIHSTVLYLDSHSAVWIGRWPYRFQKYFSRIEKNEGTKFGEWRIFYNDENSPVIAFDYTLSEPADPDQFLTTLKQLGEWFSLPLINGTKKFTCSRMAWEFPEHADLSTVEGTLNWRADWLGDARRWPALAAPIKGIRLREYWYLSMPFDCDRFQRENR